MRTIMAPVCKIVAPVCMVFKRRQCAWYSFVTMPLCVHGIRNGSSLHGTRNGASVHGTRNGVSVHGTRNSARVHGTHNGVNVHGTRNAPVSMVFVTALGCMIYS